MLQLDAKIPGGPLETKWDRPAAGEGSGAQRNHLGDDEGHDAIERPL